MALPATRYPSQLTVVQPLKHKFVPQGRKVVARPEPEPNPEDVPKHLPSETVDEYRRIRGLLQEAGNWQPANEGILEGYCAALGVLRDAERRFRSRGGYDIDAKAYGWVSMITRAGLAVSTLGKQLGLGKPPGGGEYQSATPVKSAWD